MPLSQSELDYISLFKEDIEGFDSISTESVLTEEQKQDISNAIQQGLRKDLAQNPLNLTRWNQLVALAGDSRAPAFNDFSSSIIETNKLLQSYIERGLDVTPFTTELFPLLIQSIIDQVPSENIVVHSTVNFDGDNPVVTLSNGEQVDVTDVLQNDATQTFASDLNANIVEKIKLWYETGNRNEYSYRINDDFFQVLANVLDEPDIDKRNTSLAEMYNWVKGVNFPNPEAKDVYLNVIAKTSKVPFPAEMGADEIKGILWEAWNRPEGKSYLDTDVNPRDFGNYDIPNSANEDYVEALILAWKGYDGYISIADDYSKDPDKIFPEDPNKQYKDGNGSYLMGDINQGLYGSCQSLAPIDGLLRRPGGKEYLESLVTKNDDGTYTVKLFGRNGKDLTETVSLDELIYDENWDISGKGTDYNLLNKAVAPELVQIIEAASRKSLAHYTHTDDTGAQFVDDPDFFPVPMSLVPDIKVSPDEWSEPTIENIKRLAQTDGYYGLVYFDLPLDSSTRIDVHGFALSEGHAYSLSLEGDTIKLRNTWDTQTVLSLTYDEFTALNPKILQQYSQTLADFQKKYREEHGITSAAPTLIDANSPELIAFGAKSSQIHHL